MLMPICPILKEECIQNSCMWWDDKGNLCSMLASTKILRQISKQLERVRDFKDSVEDVK